MSKTFTAWAHRLHGTTSIIDIEKGMSNGARSADGNSNQSNLMETIKNTEIEWTWGQIKLTVNKWYTKETGGYNQIYLKILSDFKLLALWPEGYKKINAELNLRAPLPHTEPQTGPCQAGREVEDTSPDPSHACCIWRQHFCSRNIGSRMARRDPAPWGSPQ